MHSTVSINLSGKDAFYNLSDYKEVTKKEMASTATLEQPIYKYTTEDKICRIVKDIFSVIFFPILLYRLVHALAGLIIIPAWNPTRLNLPSDIADQERKKINLNQEWKFKRISVEVDGNLIDGAIMGKADTFDNGRWLLASNGNGQFYEEKLNDYSFKNILTEVNGNALVFNYPFVGASRGWPNRNAMAKAYKAMLHFLEEDVGAKEIIGYGHSIGGGVQGDALCSHKLKQNIKYVFVKSRTFSDLSTIASHLTTFFLGYLVKILGWNMGSVESSKQLQAPEIIMQTASVTDYEDIAKSPDLIVHDGVIPAQSSLAKELIAQNCTDNKYFMGLQEKHNHGLWDASPLGKQIKKMLNPNRTT